MPFYTYKRCLSKVESIALYSQEHCSLWSGVLLSIFDRCAPLATEVSSVDFGKGSCLEELFSWGETLMI